MQTCDFKFAGSKRCVRTKITPWTELLNYETDAEKTNVKKTGPLHRQGKHAKGKKLKIISNQ